MTEFHQLQGRFNLAPIDARSGEKKFPFERNDDPVSLATRYKMMNDKVLERQNKESRKLKKKLNNFRTTKAEIYRVLADDGMIEPVFEVFTYTTTTFTTNSINLTIFKTNFRKC